MTPSWFSWVQEENLEGNMATIFSKLCGHCSAITMSFVRGFDGEKVQLGDIKFEVTH